VKANMVLEMLEIVGCVTVCPPCRGHPCPVDVHPVEVTQS